MLPPLLLLLPSLPLYTIHIPSLSLTYHSLGPPSPSSVLDFAIFKVNEVGGRGFNEGVVRVVERKTIPSDYVISHPLNYTFHSSSNTTTIKLREAYERGEVICDVKKGGRMETVGDYLGFDCGKGRDVTSRIMFFKDRLKRINDEHYDCEELEDNINAKLNPSSNLKELEDFSVKFKGKYKYRSTPCPLCESNKCSYVGSIPTSTLRPPSIPLSSTTELYLCRTCSTYNTFSRSDSAITTTKSFTGRCGEYSLLTYAYMTSKKIRSRWVYDSSDHLWNEVYLNGNWRHVDVCEGAVEDVGLYKGWGKEIDTVIGFEVLDGGGCVVTDLTRKYGGDEGGRGWNLEDVVDGREGLFVGRDF